ncbi:nicotinamide N-methyltransferase-like [Pelobates fuscus]|uniref:nicotinamide N-methyltransferase-like n=1 Tax=Pelobates fuscus TaxID=191477 RepID=UPI002FE4F442
MTPSLRAVDEEGWRECYGGELSVEDNNAAQKTNTSVLQEVRARNSFQELLLALHSGSTHCPKASVNLSKPGTLDIGVMASKEYKHYHDKEYHPSLLVATYVGADKKETKEEFLEVPMKMLYDVLSSGSIKGDTAIDFTVGPSLGHLMVIPDFFKEIILVDTSDANIKDMNIWLNNKPGAIDWTHAAMFVCDLKGASQSWKDQEEKLRSAVKRVVKWNCTEKDQLASVNLPQADFLISLWALEAISTNHKTFLSNLKKLSSCLKVGGHLFLSSVINTTYFKIAEHKFSVLNISEQFLQKALRDTGLSIVKSETNENKSNTHLVDHSQVTYLVARKETVV